MKKTTFIFKAYILIILLLFFKTTINAQTPPITKVDDTLKVEKSTDSIKLKYPFKSKQEGGLFLSDPAKSEIIYDTELGKYIIVEKIGNYYIERPVYMSQEEYKEYKLEKDMLGYYKNKISATNSKKLGSEEAQKNLLPTYYVESDFFQSIFGGNTIEVNPTGEVTIKMGALYQKVDNPQLSERNRSSFTFDFDQQIGASIQAKVGTFKGWCTIRYTGIF